MTEPGELTKYPVLSPVRCGGRLYEIGSNIAVTAELFEQLKPTGAIGLEPIKTTKAAPATTPSVGGVATTPSAGESAATPSVENRAAAIRAAIAKLPKSDFTTSGKPKVNAVQKIVGFDTTTAEIEAAVAAASP